jgi:hypothetical protein
MTDPSSTQARPCRDTKAELSLIGPPTPQQVICSAASNVEKSLHSVSIDVAKYFAPTAAKLMERGIGEAVSPVQILAIAMAQISGYKDLPKEPNSTAGHQLRSHHREEFAEDQQ